MPCPYFLPLEPFRDESWRKPPRVPLGEPCRGNCEAVAPSVEPEPAELREFCNSGYARGKCCRFPEQAEADAVRFSIDRHEQQEIRLIYVFERDYGPARHGQMAYDANCGRFTEAPDERRLCAQAERFLESYLRRRIVA